MQSGEWRVGEGEGLLQRWIGLTLYLRWMREKELSWRKREELKKEYRLSLQQEKKNQRRLWLQKKKGRRKKEKEDKRDRLKPFFLKKIGDIVFNCPKVWTYEKRENCPKPNFKILFQLYGFVNFFEKTITTLGIEMCTYLNQA